MWFIEIFKNSILITGLVMVMMFLIEYIHVGSSGATLKKIHNKPFLQVVIAALLGLIPGCGGGFVVVSLYAHNVFSFGALVAMMVSTLGDESFLMLTMIPKEAIFISLSLCILGILIGYITDRFVKNVPGPFSSQHFAIHTDDHHEHCQTQIWSNLKENLRHISWQRIVLLVGLLVFFVAITFGFLEHEHAEEVGHLGHEHEHTHLFSERWLNLIFAGLCLLTTVFTVFASNHFVKEHLWHHIIKHHFLRIFLWTLGALFVIEFALQFIDLERWVNQRYWLMLVAAILIGLIPESGPHIIFITLYATGTIPLSILVANCIMQDGHAGLPLLAETKKGFVYAKALKMVVAVVIALGIQFLA